MSATGFALIQDVFVVQGLLLPFVYYAGSMANQPVLIPKWNQSIAKIELIDLEMQVSTGKDAIL